MEAFDTLNTGIIEHLGETATYAGESLTVVFENESSEMLDVIGTQPMASALATDILALTGIDDITDLLNTTITIRATNYTIRELRPDSSGMVLMILEAA